MDFDRPAARASFARGPPKGKAAWNPVSQGLGNANVRSDVIELLMQPGGRKSIQRGPRRPASSSSSRIAHGERRRMEADRISLSYGPDNRIRSLRGQRRFYANRRARPAPLRMLTWSNQLTADFDPAGGAVTQLEQWGDFRYEQGDRQGPRRARRLDAGKNRKPSLSGRTRGSGIPPGRWPRTGLCWTRAPGMSTAEGNVASTREAERGQKPTAVLSDSEPFHAKAARMFAGGGNRLIRYEGGVVLWQGGNRIEADRVEIDREPADPGRQGQCAQPVRQAGRPGAKEQAAVFTLIRAAELDYSDVSHTAHCRGGVTLTRAGMEVKPSELRACSPQPIAARDSRRRTPTETCGSARRGPEGRARARPSTPSTPWPKARSSYRAAPRSSSTACAARRGALN